MKSYSQHGEDQWIFDNLHPAVGTFCEVGAFDGVSSSNTLAFEEAGWKGALIEPDPEMAWKCVLNRKSPVWCCAAGPTIGHARFYINGADKGLSGLLVQQPIMMPVMVARLHDLMAASGISPDLLSIDTEGTELGVWAGRGSVSPSIVIVEHFTLPGPSRADEIVARFSQDGYKEVHRTPTNLIFLRKT